MDLIKLENYPMNEKFKEWIKYISDEETKIVDPNRIAEECNVQIEEVYEYLNILCDNNIAVKKIKIPCSNKICDNELIIDFEYAETKEECEECNTVVTPKNYIDINGIFYDIDKSYFISSNNQRKLNTVDILVGGIKNYNDYDNVVDMRTKILDKKMKVMVEKDMKDKKIFISHAEKDEDLVYQLVNLLGQMGVPINEDSIFCSSVKGIGVPVGEDFLDYIRDKFDEDIIVLFVMTKTFFDRPACLCEVGASWVKCKEHIPLIVPPIDYSDVKGLINKSIKGIKLDDAEELDEFKDAIVKNLELNNVNNIQWNVAKKTFLSNIKSYINENSK